MAFIVKAATCTCGLKLASACHSSNLGPNACSSAMVHCDWQKEVVPIFKERDQSRGTGKKVKTDQ